MKKFFSIMLMGIMIAGDEQNQNLSAVATEQIVQTDIAKEASVAPAINEEDQRKAAEKALLEEKVIELTKRMQSSFPRSAYTANMSTFLARFAALPKLSREASKESTFNGNADRRQRAEALLRSFEEEYNAMYAFLENPENKQILAVVNIVVEKESVKTTL